MIALIATQLLAFIIGGGAFSAGSRSTTLRLIWSQAAAECVFVVVPSQSASKYSLNAIKPQRL
jgi:hypothetical protein